MRRSNGNNGASKPGKPGKKAIFANLETLLKQYDEQQKRLESNLKQLGNDS